jgi:hypothetical protein
VVKRGGEAHRRGGLHGGTAQLAGIDGEEPEGRSPARLVGSERCSRAQWRLSRWRLARRMDVGSWRR